jgi:hypothetical protein
MQTSPLRHCEPEVQVRVLQQGCTHFLLPETVLMQKHTLLVFLHRLSQLAPRRGHVGAAWAGFAAPNSPAAPNRAAPVNLRARRREMDPLANPLAKSSKERSTPVSSAWKALIHLP